MERDLTASGVSAPLQVMQSRGGLTASAVARRRPVRLFLSGPAAGVIGGQAPAARSGANDLITVDIGGTSCDIALIRHGVPVIRADGVIDGYPVRVPMVDVNSIGAGGGSIAWLDAAGGLRVGPHSAGSEPGPACYGRGGKEATVTDASVVLGYLDPDYFAGGTMRLEPKLAAARSRPGSRARSACRCTTAALGIHRVLNAQMAEGIRLRVDPPGLRSAQRLRSWRSAAAAAACDSAGRRARHRAAFWCRAFPGVLSACGLLCAPVEHEVSRRSIVRSSTTRRSQTCAGARATSIAAATS